MTKVISVLMSAYKTQDYVEESICSILDQELPPGYSLELIIGIDGCQETYDVIKNIEDCRVGIFYSEENVGTYNIFNSIFPLSTGEHFIRFDSDDIMGKNYIKTLLKNMIKNDLDVTGTKFVCFNDDMTKTINHFNRDHIADGVRMWKRKYWISKIGGYESDLLSGDTEANNRAIYGHSANFTHTDGVYFSYRNHSISLTKNKIFAAQRAKERDIIINRLKKYKKNKDIPPAIKPKIYEGSLSGLLFEESSEKIQHSFPIKIKNKVHDVRKKCLNWINNKNITKPKIKTVKKEIVKNKTNKMTITANMATTPHRVTAAKDAINSIINQVDKVRVYLNNFSEVPDFILENSKIEYICGEKDYNAAGKHFWGKNKNEYYFTIDDDIIYPPDYVSESLNVLKEYNDKAIVTCHGRNYNGKTSGYYTDQKVEVFHFKDDKRINRLVEIGGTGVSVRNTNYISINSKDINNHNMDDIEVSIIANKLKIPIIVRKGTGLKDNGKSIPSSMKIWDKFINNDSKQTNLFNSHDWKLISPECESLPNKTISVIMSAYQAEDWIVSSILSILGQKIPKDWDLELIVGIDGCDRTFNAIKDIKDKRLGIVYYSKNRGTYNTFNSTLEYSTGSIIHRFDADDIMLEGWLKRVISTFTLNKDSVCVYSSVIEVDENLTKIIKHKARNDGQAAWRREFFVNILGAYKSLPCAADTEAIFRTQANKKRIDVLKYCGFAKRIVPTALTEAKETGFGSEIREKIKKDILQDEIDYKNNVKKPPKYETSKCECIKVGLLWSIQENKKINNIIINSQKKINN